MNKIVGFLAVVFMVSCSNTDTPKPKVVPAAVPVAVSAPVPHQPMKVTFKMIVGAVRNSGDVVPIARKNFWIRPYNRDAVRAELESRHGIPLKPDQARLVCAECRAECPPSGKIGNKCREACGYCLGPDLDRKWAEQIKAWQDVAWSGSEEAFLKATPKGYTEQMVTTDLKGEVIVTLEPGTWFVSGTAMVGGSLIMWDCVPIKVNVGMGNFELSNDNATIL